MNLFSNVCVLQQITTGFKLCFHKMRQGQKEAQVRLKNKKANFGKNMGEKLRGPHPAKIQTVMALILNDTDTPGQTVG
jgi:hypothetical protein